MAFTKIVNSDTGTINLPIAIGGGTLLAGASTVVPYDIQTVGTAMADSGIIRYNMSSTDAGGSSSGSISSTPGASYSNALRPAASAFNIGAAIWNTDDNAYNYSDGHSWRDSAGNLT